MLDGGAGNDTLNGGAGADTLIGGAGSDAADYSASSTGVTVYLDGTIGSGGDATGDVLYNVENILGSGLADTLYGDGNANVLDGGAGNDTLVGGAGADTLTGGSGIDTADYSASAAGVTVHLDGTAGAGGDAAGDVLSGIENLTGSSHADMLYGDGNANLLNGGGGDDTLIGGAGADTLVGGGGNDVADYSASASAVTVHLDGTVGSGGDAAGDVLSGISGIIGSSFNDTLHGDAFANLLNGGAGDDTLIGGAGADTLVGGGGTDTADYSGSASAVTLDLSTAVGSGSSGDASGDVLNGISRVIGSSLDDHFTLGLGNGWSIDGGGGNDTVSLAANSGTVNQAQLASVLSHVGDIDFTGTNVSGDLTIDASFIQSVVGAGNGSHLTINLDGNDTLSIAAGAYSSHLGADYTFYSDSNMTTTVATLTVA